MPDASEHIVTENPWRSLRRFTDARIGLGRTGVSLPTRELLNFQIAHAQARDAVHLPLDAEALAEDLKGVTGLGEPLILDTKATDRDDYLRNPPHGETLDDASAERLKEASVDPPDLALVIADGLSSFAAQNNVTPFLQAFLDQTDGLALSRPVVVRQGRVAIGDHVGEILKARAVLVMIGERPGLSSPDSLGLYFTWAPETGLHDARRNCISNVRSAGLDFERAAARATWLLSEARKIDTSGVKLKDRSSDGAVDADDRATSFLSAPSKG